MTKIQEISWVRISAEGVAIVVSILLAFWIQAWWDDKQQEADERIVLQSLLEDLYRLQAQSAQDQILSGVLFESATKLLRANSELSQPIIGPEIDKLIGKLLWFNTASFWESAPLNSLMMGGDISQISNAALALELAALQVQMDRLQSNFDIDERIYNDQWITFLSKNSDLVQIFMTVEQEYSTQIEYQFPEIAVSTIRDHSELLSNVEFRGILIQRIDLQINSRVFVYPKLDEKLEEVISLLEAELVR